MTETHTPQLATPTSAPPRKVVRRTRGSRHGPITRLMSPSDLGQVLKPNSGDTSHATLRAGEQRLREIQHRLQDEGRL